MVGKRPRGRVSGGFDRITRSRHRQSAGRVVEPPLRMKFPPRGLSAGRVSPADHPGSVRDGLSGGPHPGGTDGTPSRKPPFRRIVPPTPSTLQSRRRIIRGDSSPGGGGGAVCCRGAFERRHAARVRANSGRARPVGGSCLSGIGGTVCRRAIVERRHDARIRANSDRARPLSGPCSGGIGGTVCRRAIVERRHDARVRT